MYKSGTFTLERKEADTEEGFLQLLSFFASPGCGESFWFVGRALGNFWRPLRFCTKEIGLIVSVCCKLHNICVDSFGSKSDSFTVSQEDIYWKRTTGHVSEPDSRVMWTDDIPVTQGTRSDLMTSTGRDLITQHIKELGLKRPLHSTLRKIERIRDKTAVTV